MIPTLGQRLEYLRETLISIREQSIPADITVVTPASAVQARLLAVEFDCVVLDDPGSLPAAINLGVSQSQPQHVFVNWLGDDDLLTPHSLESTITALKENASSVVSYGACRYIDNGGTELWVSRAGRWANRILSWGPDLIPQPGMLIRLSAWREVCGLDQSLSHAFDLDLLLKLKKQGEFTPVDQVVSCFRWHPESLTVSNRTKSLDESELVKRRYMSPQQIRVKWMWEKPVRVATRIAATRLNKRAYRLSAAKSSG